MTFDDDFLRFSFDGRLRTVTCKKLGFEWPPPEVLDLFGFKFKQVSRSMITDDARADMTHVARGAAYEPAVSEDGKP